MSFYGKYPTSGSGGGVPIYATLVAFPGGTAAGDLAVAADTGNLYEWSGLAWQQIAGPGAALAISNFGSTPNAAGLTLSGGVLNMQPANATYPGGVSTAAQTLAGVKTFQDGVVSNSINPTADDAGSLGSNAQNGPAWNALTAYNIYGAASGYSGGPFLWMDTFHAIMYDLAGDYGTAKKVMDVVNRRLYNGSDALSIDFALHKLYGGSENLSADYDNRVLVSADGSTEVLNWLGNTGVKFGKPISLLGSTSGTLTLAAPAIVTDYTVTMPAAQGGVSTFLKNNGSGVLTWGTPAAGNLTDVGTDGILITGGTGAVLGAGTSIAQQVSDSTHNGYLSSTDWSTFNSKQAAGNYITALTGDATASGPGSAALTLATVNSNVGSFGSSTSIPSFTVNGKGLITASSGNVVIAPAGTLTGTTLAANVVTSSLTAVGTLTSGTWNATTVDVAHGGTGQVTLTNHGVLIGAATTGITQLAAAASGTLLTGQGASSDPSFSATPTLGIAGTTLGTLSLCGNTSGTIVIKPQAAAGSYNFNLPITAGSSGEVLTSAGGAGAAMTWSSVVTNPMTTAGDMIYGGASGVPTRLVTGSAGHVPISAGSTVAFGSLQGNSTALKAPTIQSLTSTGTTAGYVFTITSGNATVGSTWTNNSQTYTCLATIASGTVLFCSGANAPQASGTLTKATGSGDATLTFSAAKTLAVYTTPSGPTPLYLKIKMAGGGGGGGGGGTIATSPTSGTAGTASRFGESLLAFCNGGAGGGRSANSGKGGAGGTASTGSASGLALSGGMGGAAGTSAVITEGIPGGAGGSGPLGGAASGDLVSTTGGVGATNTGAGGGGGGSATSTQNGGGFGGGAGGYAEFIIPSPSGSYYYTVGTGGANGASGTSGANGGSGGSGVIYVEEYYQ